MQLLSFHNKPDLKQQYLKRVISHYKKNEITATETWSNGKGNAIGCTVHSINLIEFEKQLGIPQLLGYIENKIYLGLEPKQAPKFPSEFLSNVPIGKNLKPVALKFLAWILEQSDAKIKSLPKNYVARLIIKETIETIRGLISGKEMNSGIWASIQTKAFAAAYSSAHDFSKAAAFATSIYANPGIIGMAYEKVNTAFLYAKAANAAFIAGSVAIVILAFEVMNNEGYEVPDENTSNLHEVSALTIALAISLIEGKVNNIIDKEKLKPGGFTILQNLMSVQIMFTVKSVRAIDDIFNSFCNDNGSEIYTKMKEKMLEFLKQ